MDMRTRAKPRQRKSVKQDLPSENPNSPSSRGYAERNRRFLVKSPDGMRIVHVGAPPRNTNAVPLDDLPKVEERLSAAEPELPTPSPSPNFKTVPDWKSDYGLGKGK